VSEDLVTWLRAQIDEDEQQAQQAARDTAPKWYRYERYIMSADPHPASSSDEADLYIAMDGTEATMEHMARHDPARVLAEVEAKRRILDLHEVVDNGGGTLDSRYCACCFADRGYNAGVSNKTGEGLPVWCETVRLLALPYAGRDGWREEWR
jgi:hypothetical protein